MSWEASLEQQLGSRATLTATYFDQRFRDLIQYVLGDASTDFRGTNQNLGAATARGVELEARAPSVGRFDLGANVTLLRTRVTDAGNGAFGTFVDGERLLRRPDKTAAFNADYRIARGSKVGAALRFVGNRDDRDFNNDVRVELPSYTVMDLSAEVSSLGASSRTVSTVADGSRRERVRSRLPTGVRLPGAWPNGADRCARCGRWESVAELGSESGVRVTTLTPHS